MNTAAVALPHREPLFWRRVRGLYNGVGYVTAVALLQSLWWSAQSAMPALLGGHFLGFLRGLSIGTGWTFVSALAGPLVIPVMVNLAPRSGLKRIGYLAMAVIVPAWWCLQIVDGVHFDLSLRSLGIALNGLLTLALVVGVCVYHSDSRGAADSLLRARIEGASRTAELQRAQLRLLRAQIEPHFLFNTLSVVRALSRTDRAASVAMLDNLIRYFEAALPRLRENEVPLAQEMELIEAYLAIYRARMGTRLDYLVELPAELAQIRVPPMMLLTLVENALKHGVNPLTEGGIVRVSASRDGSCLRLAVADSGRGLDLRHGRGAGLANIRQRLLLMYGASAVLSLRPAEPRGVVASIWIPAA